MKHQVTQVTQSPYSPDLVSCNFWIFPKLKSPLKGKRFQTVNEFQKNMTGAADGDWENCVRSQGDVDTVLSRYIAYFEGTEVSLSYAQFHVSCIILNKCLYFSYYMAGYLLDRRCILAGAIDPFSLILLSSSLLLFLLFLSFL